MTTPGPIDTHGHGGQWRFFSVIWILLSMVAAIWSVGMPLNTGPDEPAHFVKAAAVVRGQLGGTPSNEGTVVQVPDYVAFTQALTCTSYHAERAANCETWSPQTTGQMMNGTTTAGTYNPLYYVLVGWPTLLVSDQTGLYAMRLVSGILASGFLALGFMMLCSWNRRIFPLVGALIALTPMVIYINGVVNPSSLEIATAFAAFIALLSVIVDKRPSLLIERTVILTVAAAIACNTRSITPLWVALLLLIPLLLLGRKALADLLRQRAVWAGITIVVLASAGGVAWTVLSDSLALANPQYTGTTVYDNVGASPLFGFVKMVMLSVNLGQQMIGILGWFDVQLPSLVYFLWSALIGILGTTAALILRGRRALAALCLFAVMIIGPAVVQAIYITSGGFIWQGRYTLPLFVCAVVGVAVLVSETWTSPGARLMRRLSIFVGAIWVVCQLLSLLQALRRYSVGASGSYQAIFTSPAWSPPLTSLTLMAIGLVAFSITAHQILRQPSDRELENKTRPRLNLDQMGRGR